MKTQIHKQLAIVAMLLSLVFVATSVMAKKPIKPPPVPDDEPVLSQPAFAYFGKPTGNSGAVYLANADGSAPVKVLTTNVSTGELAVFQAGTTGKVLVIEYGNLWRFDYTVDEEGFLVSAEDPQMLLSGDVWRMAWSPVGDDFAAHDIFKVYLGSRINYDTGDRGEPIVVSPATPWETDDELLMSLAWSADGQTLYFTKWCIDSDGPWWYEVHKAEVGDYLKNGGTQFVTQCLLATREAPHSGCLEIDKNLINLYSVSHGDDGLMVSALGVNHLGGNPEETYFTYILDDLGTWKYPTPEFKGHDWTANGSIIGQTDDDAILEFDPDTGDFKVLIKRFGTSPDWNN